VLKWALIFFVISIVAGFFGFSGLSAATAGIARVLFFIAIIIFAIFMVLRCFVWVETTSGGRTEVELSGDEIDDGGEVSNGAIAASLCLGGLYEAVDSLDETIGDLAMEPA
jgi:uncharacterized membrane protein YtjA (UPF0391 family)